MINDGRKDIPKYFSDIVILLEGPQPTNILTLYGWAVVKEPRPRVTRPPTPSPPQLSHTRPGLTGLTLCAPDVGALLISPSHIPTKTGHQCQQSHRED